MRKLLPAFFIMILAAAVAGTSIGYENVTVDLRDSSVEADMYVEELTSSSFSYITSYSISNVEAELGGQSSSCEINELQVGSEISCETSLRENFTAELSFHGSEFITESSTFSTFNYQHSVYRPTDSFNLKVILPEGKGVLQQSNSSTPVISPQEHSTGTVAGRNIFIKWHEEPQLGETLSFQARYESLSEQQNGYNQIVLGALGALILVLLGYASWRLYIREPIESVYEEIDSDEKEVLDLIRENDGQMLQKDIVAESDYSKAKISGLVKELVERGVLKKEKEGRSNRLKISKKYHG